MESTRVERVGEQSSGHGADTLLLAICGWTAVVGVIAAMLSNVVGSFLVPDYDWIADTISHLAAGRWEIIQDVGLYAYAASLMACALGTAHLHQKTRRWTAGVVALAAMSALTAIIGARNEYGDHDGVATWGIHLAIVYTLMLLFLAVTLLMAEGLSRYGSGYRKASLACAGASVAIGAAFIAAPTGYDGLVERLVVLVTMAWVLTLSRLLLGARRNAAV